ncbi:hypothetical protein EDD99_1796 [Streptomyces sp. 846.5]|nr:hypothetical protein [Streptomyces sp. 846.5]TDU03374.1 hypothetical protein EDD99_1796 [Streptomyces sp. 846.5]
MHKKLAWLVGTVAGVLAIGVGVTVPAAFDGGAAVRHALANTSGPAAQTPTGTAADSGA